MASLPFSTLLSQALVAFVIEFDNQAECQLPHRTTNRNSSKDRSTKNSLAKAKSPIALPTPWLVSMAMWWNCMKYVGENGVTVRDLETLVRSKTNLNGMERWGYVTVSPGTAASKAKGSRAKPLQRDSIIRATPAGRMAQEIWRPLSGVIEDRWRERFGKIEVSHLENRCPR